MADQRVSSINEGRDILFVDAGSGHALAVTLTDSNGHPNKHARTIVDGRDIKFVDTGSGRALAVSDVGG